MTNITPAFVRIAEEELDLSHGGEDFRFGFGKRHGEREKHGLSPWQVGNLMARQKGKIPVDQPNLVFPPVIGQNYVRGLCGCQVACDWLAVDIYDCEFLVHCGGLLIGLIAAYDAPG
jgi:hypothetical protein